MEHPPSCLPLLTCVLGGVRTTPLPRKRRGGRAPSWPPPSRPLNSPGACDYCHRLASTTSSHATEVQTVGGKNETVAPANRRRRFRGLTKMAAAVSAATTSTSTSTTTLSLPPARPVLSRETVSGGWECGEPRVLA